MHLDHDLEISTEKFIQARNHLRDEEWQLRFDAISLRDQTSAERQADEIITRLRNNETESIYSGMALEPGHHFHRALQAIDRTEVMRVARRAPKGALLHCHSDAMLTPEKMLPMAQRMVNMHIKVSIPLITPDALIQALPEMSLLSQQAAVAMEGVSVFDKSYRNSNWMLYSLFRQQFPGGETTADEWIVSKIKLQEEDIYQPYQTVNGIWKHMNNSMRINRGLLRYESAWRESIRLIIRNLVDDGISYAEVRFALHQGSVVMSDTGDSFLSRNEMLKSIQEVNDEEIQRLSHAGHVFYGLRVIYANLRGCSPEQMKWCIDDVIELKQKFPKLICGFDLCGQEDAGKPLSSWIPDLLDLKERCKKLDIELPLILHAGETLDHGGGADCNLFDAILLGSKRIGHGFSLSKHPLLVEICKERNIAIEICSTSNEILGLCRQIQEHPVYDLLARSVPCTVNTDDPGFWGSSSSYEFYQIMIGSKTVSLASWKRLAELSFEHSCMSAEEKVKRIASFKEDWEIFCGWIVKTYSADK